MYVARVTYFNISTYTMNMADHFLPCIYFLFADAKTNSSPGNSDASPILIDVSAKLVAKEIIPTTLESCPSSIPITVKGTTAMCSDVVEVPEENTRRREMFDTPIPVGLPPEKLLYEVLHESIPTGSNLVVPKLNVIGLVDSSEILDPDVNNLQPSSDDALPLAVVELETTLGSSSPKGLVFGVPTEHPAAKEKMLSDVGSRAVAFKITELGESCGDGHEDHNDKVRKKRKEKVVERLVVENTAKKSRTVATRASTAKRV